MKTYLIGRDKACDIVIDDASISRKHAELVVTQSGRYYLTDRASTHGTRIAKDGAWQEITQDFVAAPEYILLGRYQITMEQLAEMVPNK